MSAYSDALKMLARRELSEAQIRQRLARREHSPAEIDAAVARLHEQRELDDVRVAETIARADLARHRGERRLLRHMTQAGIAPGTARRVAREASQSVDVEAQIEASLERRLRHGTPISDVRQFRRLFRYLIGQGFSPDRVLHALKSRSSRQDWPDD